MEAVVRTPVRTRKDHCSQLNPSLALSYIPDSEHEACEFRETHLPGLSSHDAYVLHDTLLAKASLTKMVKNECQNYEMLLNTILNLWLLRH